MILFFPLKHRQWILLYFTIKPQVDLFSFGFFGGNLLVYEIQRFFKEYKLFAYVYQQTYVELSYRLLLRLHSIIAVSVYPSLINSCFSSNFIHQFFIIKNLAMFCSDDYSFFTYFLTAFFWSKKYNHYLSLNAVTKD